MKLYTDRKPIVMKINCDKKSFWLSCLIQYNRVFKTNFTAVTNPITHTIHSIENINEHSRVYEHEKIHILQSLYYGKVRFLILYLLYTVKYGYDKNPFETEAYKNESTCQCIENDKTVYIK